MKRIVRLTESDLARIVRRVINEQNNEPPKVQVEFSNYKMTFRYYPMDNSIICTGLIKNPYKPLKQQDQSNTYGSDVVMKYTLKGWGMQSQFNTEIGRTIIEKINELKSQIVEYRKKNPIQIK